MIGAWILAILCSFPQWFVHQTFDVVESWTQCSSIWEVERFQTFNLQHYYFPAEKAYLMVHLVTVFWLPFTTIAACYLAITMLLLRSTCQRTDRYDVCRTTLASNRYIHFVDLQFMKFKFAPLSYSPGRQNGSSGDMTHASRPLIRVDVPNSANDLLMYRSDLQGLPVWRFQLRSRIFRTAGLVVVAYVLCWLPYNVLSFIVLVDFDLSHTLSDHASILKGLILVNAVINPFLYGFNNRQ